MAVTTVYGAGTARYQGIEYVRTFSKQNRGINPAWYGKWWSIMASTRIGLLQDEMQGPVP